MGHIEVPENKLKKIEYFPCIKCGSEDIDFNDCGYSSFNVAWGKCKNCNHEIKISNCGCDISKESIIKNWNKHNDPLLLFAQYNEQIEALNKLIKELPINTPMNLINALKAAQEGELISRVSKPETFLKYIKNNCFFQYQIIDGKAIFKYEVWDFTLPEILSTDWIIIPNTFFKEQ